MKKIILQIGLTSLTFISSILIAATDECTPDPIMGDKPPAVLLEDEMLVKGETTSFEALILCKGTYGFYFSFQPKDNIFLIVTDDGLNRYSRNIELDNGNTELELINSFEIFYSVTITSLVNPKKSVYRERNLTIRPSQQSSSSGARITIGAPMSLFNIFGLARNFDINETLEINISISAENEFYEIYGSISSGFIPPPSV